MYHSSGQQCLVMFVFRISFDSQQARRKGRRVADPESWVDFGLCVINGNILLVRFVFVEKLSRWWLVIVKFGVVCHREEFVCTEMESLQKR
jgi:hypothetical protein